MTRRSFLAALSVSANAQSIARYRSDRYTVKIPLLAGPSNTAYSLAASAVQSLNLYPESIGEGGKNRIILRGRPGLSLFKNVADIDALASPIRGLWSGGGRLFVAAGSKEFEIDSSGNLVGSVHTIASDLAETPVTLLPNSNQLLIVASGAVYCDNGLGPVQVTFPALSGQCTTLGKLVLAESTPNGSTGHTDTFDVGMIGQTITINGTGYTVSAVTNPTMLQLTTSAGVQSFHDWSATPILAAPQAAFMDGFYLAPRTGTRQFNQSKPLDGSTWAALDSDLKEGYPDNLVALWAEPPLLYALGTETMQVYRDTGKADGTSFEVVDGGFARVGLGCQWSPVSLLGKLHMIAGGTYGGFMAVRMEGVTPIRVSTPAVEEALNGSKVPSDGVSWSYLEHGHLFWVLHFKTGTSWVYDVTESAKQGEPIWHERDHGTSTPGLAYQPRFHTFIPEWGLNGTHIVGDYNSGKLYALDSATYSDYGISGPADIRYVRALPYVYKENRRIFQHRFEVVIEAGTAPAPLDVRLDWSDDNGQTWGTAAGGPGTYRTLGPDVIGTYTTRFFTAGLGSSRGRVYRLTIIGQGKIAIIDATLEATVGSA